MKTGKKRLAFVSGMIISAVFLVLAFRGLQFEQFRASLSEINLTLIAVAMLVYFLAVLVIAFRWQCLLRAVKLVPLASLNQLVLIGYMGNNVYPFRAGDALRVVLLRRNHLVPLLRSATVVVIERLFDGSVMIAFLLFSLLLIDVDSNEVETIVAVTTPLFVVAMLCAFLLAAKPDALRRVVKFASWVLPGRLGTLVSTLGEEVIAGLGSLRSPIFLLAAVISSLVTWGIEAGVYWIVMFAFGLELNFAVALLLVGAVNLAGLIPASPGQVGVNEFVIITLLTALNVPPATATAYAIMVHIVIWLPVVVVGFALLLRQGLGWTDIRRANKMEGAAA